MVQAQEGAGSGDHDHHSVQENEDEEGTSSSNQEEELEAEKDPVQEAEPVMQRLRRSTRIRKILPIWSIQKLTTMLSAVCIIPLRTLCIHGQLGLRVMYQDHMKKLC
ncbi:hypothetical protein DY000_02040067 [Brassica cretica]|uniref:Uncharacterized protein n=1 Tax=Brassica cretica TaxID=69181 RepID=A0ABQ7BIR5_BRACR|nr:hypothetical protein DY000_02040067 [Brassica cretica]